MPHEGEDLPMACKSTLHLAFPRQGTGPTERDLIPAETPIESSESVPQIEMKLESSDDEDEEFEKSEPCPFPQIRKSPGVDMRVLLMCQKRKGNASDGGKGDLVDDLPRSSAGPHGQFAVRPIRKRKAKSEVWQFFYRDANNVCRAVCSICRISVSRGKLGGNFGTTALKRHLESKHPMEWAQRESMRLQRRDEEDEETFEEKEPNERSFNDPIMEYHFKEASKYGAMGSSETYEIIDSSDDGEDVDKVQGQGAQVELDEEIEMKGLKVLTREDLKKMNRYRGLPIDSGAKLSIGMAHATSSATGFFCNRDLPLAPPETKKRRSTSAVWQFFYIDHENTCRAICTLCHLSVSRGTRGSNLGTSALIRHLEVKHPLEWGKVKSEKPKIFGIIEVEDEEEEPDEPIELYAQQQQTPSGLQSLADCSEYSESSANLAPEPPTGPLEYDPRVVIGKSEKLLSSEDPHMVFNHNDLTRNGKYTPSHQKAQAWNQNIAELVCGLALPYSFINSRAFQMFMQRADPLYSLPPKSFFSGKAIPQMFDAVCKQVAGELKRSECPHVHVAAHVWSMDLPMNFLALSAHWAVFDSGDQPSISRKHAVLCVKSFPKEFNESNIQQELVRQVNLWLSPNTLSPGFFISSGDFSLIHAIKGANFSYVSSFPHSLNLLILDFLQSNRFITGMLAVARKVCSHFAHSAWAGKRLRELQHQYNLPKHSLKQETVQHWTSTFYMLQRLLEQQRVVQEYLAKHTLEVADDLLTPSHWKLMITLVYLLQPFEMATREANAKDCSLSQVLPGIRYLHIFLRQIRGHFEGKGDSAGVVLVDGFTFKFSSDFGLNEMFQKEEYVLSTLLDPRFKGRIEAILPTGFDINHWKQILVKKVKEVLSSDGPLYPAKRLYKPDPDCDSELLHEKHYSREEPVWRDVAAPPLIQKNKSLIEHLESVGLMASKTTGASLSTESHSASVMVEKYLQDNKTIGAKEDPLGYWEKRRLLWPPLTKLAVMYLTCPPSSTFAERVFTSFHSSADTQRSLDMVEGMEHLAFLKTNLENFPHYSLPTLVCSSDNEEEQSDREGGF